MKKHGGDGTEKAEEAEKRGLLNPGERIDDLERNGYHIIQNPGKFCFGMDAVLLSGFAKASAGEQVLDLGTGTGIVPILMEAKTEAAHLTGLEIQPESADMARRSVRLNHLEEKITILEGDLKEASKLFPPATFDVVTVNPPYMASGGGLKNPDSAKAIARHEILCTLRDVVRESAKVLKSGGKFYMVHRPYRLVEQIELLRSSHLEPKRMKFVHPYVDREANMVLIEAVKDGGSQMTVEAPVIVFDENGKYTEQITETYGY